MEGTTSPKTVSKTTIQAQSMPAAVDQANDQNNTLKNQFTQQISESTFQLQQQSPHIIEAAFQEPTLSAVDSLERGNIIPFNQPVEIDMTSSRADPAKQEFTQDNDTFRGSLNTGKGPTDYRPLRTEIEGGSKPVEQEFLSDFAKQRRYEKYIPAITPQANTINMSIDQKSMEYIHTGQTSSIGETARRKDVEKTALDRITESLAISESNPKSPDMSSNLPKQYMTAYPERNQLRLESAFVASFGEIPHVQDQPKSPIPMMPPQDPIVQEAVSKHMSHSKTSEKLLNWQNIVNSQRNKKENERQQSFEVSEGHSRQLSRRSNGSRRTAIDPVSYDRAAELIRRSQGLRTSQQPDRRRTDRSYSRDSFSMNYSRQKSADAPGFSSLVKNNNSFVAPVNQRSSQGSFQKEPLVSPQNFRSMRQNSQASVEHVVPKQIHYKPPILPNQRSSKIAAVTAPAGGEHRVESTLKIDDYDKKKPEQDFSQKVEDSRYFNRGSVQTMKQKSRQPSADFVETPISGAATPAFSIHRMSYNRNLDAELAALGIQPSSATATPTTPGILFPSTKLHSVEETSTKMQMKVSMNQLTSNVMSSTHTRQGSMQDEVKQLIPETVPLSGGDSGRRVPLEPEMAANTKLKSQFEQKTESVPRPPQPELGVNQDSWFTQVYHDLQTKNQQLSEAHKRIADLEVQNEQLRLSGNPEFTANFSNFIERLDSLINAQNYFKNEEPCKDFKAMFNKLESLLADHKIQTKKHLKTTLESDKTIELLKKIILIQDKCWVERDQKSDAMLLKSKLRTSVEAIEDTMCSRQSFMQRLAWVENIQEPRSAIDLSKSERSQSNKKSDRNLSTQVKTEIKNQLQSSYQETCAVKVENTQLKEKLSELSKKYQQKKDEIRRLVKYEVFFEKQRMKKYRNCGCQVGQSVHAKGLVIRDKKSGAVISRKKENKQTSVSPNTYKTGPSPVTPNSGQTPNALASLVSPNTNAAVSQDNNVLLQYHIKQTQELHLLLKSYMDKMAGLHGANTDRSFQNNDANELISRSKSILQSIDDGLHQMSSSSFLKVGDLKGFTLKTDQFPVTKSMDRRAHARNDRHSASEGLTSRGGNTKRSAKSPIFQSVDDQTPGKSQHGESAYMLPLGVDQSTSMPEEVKPKARMANGSTITRISAPSVKDRGDEKGSFKGSTKQQRRTKTPQQQRGSGKSGSRKSTSTNEKKKSSVRVYRKRASTQESMDGEVTNLQDQLKVARERIVEASMLESELREIDVNRF